MISDIGSDRPHITPADHRASLPGSSAKQAARKQQLRTWKLQQQSEEEKRRLEDEERSKREEEIRKIRDLSNQDEQYNRFMKLVGGKAQDHSRVRPPDGAHFPNDIPPYTAMWTVWWW